MQRLRQFGQLRFVGLQRENSRRRTIIACPAPLGRLYTPKCNVPLPKRNHPLNRNRNSAGSGTGVVEVLEYLLHYFGEKPHLRVAAIVSLVVGALSALFNRYAMRRGTLLVGAESSGYGGILFSPKLTAGWLHRSFR